tara:strand:- start:2180 stop:2374 length:195 start_codon:yes stop_codon:yes gene_type:complete
LNGCGFGAGAIFSVAARATNSIARVVFLVGACVFAAAFSRVRLFSFAKHHAFANSPLTIDFTLS